MFNIHFSIERWKWNAEYELWVSNKGHFRTAEKREVPVQVGNTGYCMVYCGGNVHRHLLAHRVVMLTWKPTANAELLTVDHLDHNKRNNAVSNLEWVTLEENQRRAQADHIVVKVEGNSDLVEKVAVTIVPKELAQTEYPYYIQFTGGATLSVEQVAAMFFETHSKAFGEGNTITDLATFTKIIHERSKSSKKILGLKFTRIPRQ